MKRVILLAFLFVFFSNLSAQEGTLDPSFGNNGYYASSQFLPSLVLTNEGKLVSATTTSNGFKIDRYNSDGSPDASFGNNGEVQSGFIVNDGVRQVLVQSNGKIVVAGETQGGIDIPLSFQYYFAIARYNYDGSKDLSFGYNGMVLINSRNNRPPSFNGIFISNTNIIVLALQFAEPGSSNPAFYFISQGGTSFGLIGPPHLSRNAYTFLYTLAVSNAGKVIVEGVKDALFEDKTANKIFFNLYRNGIRDSSFGTNGYVILNESVQNLTLQNETKFIGKNGNKLTRFNIDGSVDASFGNGGNVNVAFPINTINIQEDEKIIIGGSLNGDFALARFNANGTPDISFGTNGMTTTDFGGDESISQLKIGGKRIYAYGSGILAAYRLNACTPPTFLNNAQTAVNATCGRSNGSISIVPSSGMAPFMYSINRGATYVNGPDQGYTFSNLAAGTYQLKMKDATGCQSAIIEKTITSIDINCPSCTPPTFLNNGQIVLDATCGKNDGNISIIPTSGTAPFMYSINGGSTYVSGPNAGYTFNNLGAGTYQLKLKDANNCESAVVERRVKTTGGPTFLNNSQIVLDATCGKNDGNISIIPTSGNAPFVYSIDEGVTYVSGPNGGYTFNNLAPGTYKLRLADARGCESAIVDKAVNQNKDCPLMTIVPTPGYATGVAEIPVRKEAVVLTYPNPSKGQFRLQLQNFISPKAEVSIFDGKGTLVEKRWVNAGEGSATSFNLGGHSKGMYYIKIVTGKGTKSSKILIQ